MKHLVTYSICLLLLSSCQFFETEKITSETFYEQEKAQIDWKDIDRYPMFPSCDTASEKLTQRKCFETTILEHIHTSIQQHPLETATEIRDTVWIHFEISNEGAFRLSEPITMDSITRKSLPFLAQWIQHSLDSLADPEPAYKRGIPVKTHFSLPLVLATTD